jgi:hypothetical protein
MSAETYLGEMPFDHTTHPIFKDYTPKDWALHWIMMYGSIDGAHHKDWVLDQVAQILNGVPVTAVLASWTDNTSEVRFSLGVSTHDYMVWVGKARGEWDAENEEWEYDYSHGTAP